MRVLVLISLAIHQLAWQAESWNILLSVLIISLSYIASLTVMILLYLSLSLWLDHHSSMHKLFNQLILTDETKTSLHSDMQSLLEMDALSSWNPTNKYCILFLLLCSLEQKGKAKLSFKEFNLMDIGDMLEYWFSPIYLA
jgi:hypothetical protein